MRSPTAAEFVAVCLWVTALGVSLVALDLSAAAYQQARLALRVAEEVRAALRQPVTSPNMGFSPPRAVQEVSRRTWYVGGGAPTPEASRVGAPVIVCWGEGEP